MDKNDPKSRDGGSKINFNGDGVNETLNSTGRTWFATMIFNERSAVLSNCGKYVENLADVLNLSEICKDDIDWTNPSLGMKSINLSKFGGISIEKRCDMLLRLCAMSDARYNSL